MSEHITYFPVGVLLVLVFLHAYNLTVSTDPAIAIRTYQLHV